MMIVYQFRAIRDCSPQESQVLVGQSSAQRIELYE